MAAESVHVLQERIRLYEDGVREIRRLAGEIDERRNTLTQAEAKLSKLSSDEADLSKNKTQITSQISFFKERRSESESDLSKTKSEATVKRLTEDIRVEDLEIQITETNLEKVDGKLEALAKEM